MLVILLVELDGPKKYREESRKSNAQTETNLAQCLAALLSCIRGVRVETEAHM